MAGSSNNEKGASFLVGIDSYDDVTLKNFKNASSQRGVERLKTLLSKPASQYWPPQKEYELVHRVEYDDLERKLTKFLAIKEYTSVLIYLSGHGYQYWDEEDEKYRGYFATSNSLISNPDFKNNDGKLIAQFRGLAFNTIAKLIKKADHLKSLTLLIDACHSGNAVKADTLQTALLYRQSKSSNKADADTFRFCIIPSSLDVEDSWNEEGMGVFTKKLVEILADGSQGPITTEQLKAKIKDNFEGRHQQTIKTYSAGDAILLFDYAATGITAPAQKPLRLKDGQVRNPYQGLEAFDADSAELFFGRDTVIKDIIGRFSETYFVPVIGASGSGKSSVVRAGVFPALEGDWALMSMVPTSDPLSKLKSTLEDHIRPLLSSSSDQEALKLFTLQPTVDAFAELLEKLPKNKNFWLFRSGYAVSNGNTHGNKPLSLKLSKFLKP
jgi:hypothetical protein